VDVCSRVEASKNKGAARAPLSDWLLTVHDHSAARDGTAVTGQSSKKPYDDMNNIVAHVLLNMTR
jgi:hypothetical protein